MLVSLCDNPGFFVIDILVRLVGEGHNQTNRFTVLACLEVIANFVFCSLNFGEQVGVIWVFRKVTIEAFTDKASTATCYVHYLANYGDLLKRWDTVLDEKGVQKVKISDTELASFRSTAADPIRAAWIADMESKGIPGQELYDLVMSTLENTRKGN